ncbi:MAG: glutaredoxin family protein [Synechococcus sp.]|nr:glutaredoxin family protein [Synechococcus sp.]
MVKQIIFYSKPGCHLCEGLEEKLAQVAKVQFQLEMRDITTNPDWFARYQYEIPVLCVLEDGQEKELPRFSPRMAVAKLEEKLIQYLG